MSDILLLPRFTSGSPNRGIHCRLLPVSLPTGSGLLLGFGSGLLPACFRFCLTDPVLLRTDFRFRLTGRFPVLLSRPVAGSAYRFQFRFSSPVPMPIHFPTGSILWPTGFRNLAHIYPFRESSQSALNTNEK